MLWGKKDPRSQNEWSFGELVLEGVASCRSEGEIAAPSPAAGLGSGDRVLWELGAGGTFKDLGRTGVW